MVLHEARLLISVIVPVYNAASYLRRCVESLLAQTFTHYEVILVDDGSTDESKAIVDEYARHKNVRVIHQPNAGVSAARNRGIDIARGEYISFVDADDWVNPTFLQVFADEALKRKALGETVDCIVQGYVNHEGEHIQEAYTYMGTADEIGANLYHIEEKGLLGYVWNKVVRRAVIDTHHVRFDSNIPIGEDFLFCMEAIGHCRRMTVLPDVGYNYFYPPGDHKDYAFEAWNRRLDAFATLLPTMHIIPTAVANGFKAKDFKMSLYVLRIAYHERLPRSQRMAFLKRTRLWGKGNTAVQLREYEPSFFVLAIMVLYLPLWLCDAILITLRQIR